MKFIFKRKLLFDIIFTHLSYKFYKYQYEEKNIFNDFFNTCINLCKTILDNLKLFQSQLD